MKFQSTHPHGVRRAAVARIYRPGCVSIHAPSRGATCEDVRNTILVIKFQSTHPHGVRPTPELMPIARTAFQSTHPHGVRLWPSFGRCCECRCFNPRTLTGCDTGRVLCGLFPFLFQSTHPHGVRRWRAMRNCVMHMFQSTHPHGVRLVLYGPATGIAWRFNPRTLTGCDGQNESQSKTSHCFNPRTLTGCDVAIKAGDNVIWNVSIHAPSRGTTRVLVEKAHWEYVSIHAPSRGATNVIM